MPVIEDDGFVLYKSMAINFYLAKKHNSPLYPSDPHDEALALQWSFWEIDRLDRQLANYLTHTSGLPEAERDKSIADAAWAEVEPAMNALNGALGKTRWLAGPAFSIADLNVAARAVARAWRWTSAVGRRCATGSRVAGTVRPARRRARCERAEFDRRRTVDEYLFRHSVRAYTIPRDAPR